MTTPAPDFRRLLARTAWAVASALAAIVVCYYWVDRPVAFYVHRHGLPQTELFGVPIFKWLTFPPPTVQTWSPLVLAILMIRRAWGPLSRCERTLFIACLSLIVADEFRTSLGDVCGRYWPETWFDDNPSLIGTGTYGFHPFQAGDDRGSFPSGHAARIFGFATVWWVLYRRSRGLLTVICLPMLASLVLMNYHFVGDVIAGATLGAIIAGYAIALAELVPPRSP